RHAFAAEARDVRFAYAIPYVEENLHTFLKQYARHPHLRVEPLAKTVKGRQVELLRVGQLEDDRSQHILLTCRHHACESMANYALEGLLTEVLADTAEGRWLREHTTLWAIPFMDKDGVEEGDQGKLRRPHDHWLDYGGRSRYPSVRALKGTFAGKRARPVALALDLHCPYIRD